MLSFFVVQHLFTTDRTPSTLQDPKSFKSDWQVNTQIQLSLRWLHYLLDTSLFSLFLIESFTFFRVRSVVKRRCTECYCTNRQCTVLSFRRGRTPSIDDSESIGSVCVLASNAASGHQLSKFKGKKTVISSCGISWYPVDNRHIICIPSLLTVVKGANVVHLSCCMFTQKDINSTLATYPFFDTQTLLRSAYRRVCVIV